MPPLPRSEQPACCDRQIGFQRNQTSPPAVPLRLNPERRSPTRRVGDWSIESRAGSETGAPFRDTRRAPLRTNLYFGEGQGEGERSTQTQPTAVGHAFPNAAKSANRPSAAEKRC